MSYWGSNYWGSNYWGSNYWGLQDGAAPTEECLNGIIMCIMSDIMTANIMTDNIEGYS